MTDAVRRFVCVLGLVLGAAGCGPTTGENPSSGGCGDGVVQQQETCDDGQHVGGDGCNGACQVEQGWQCTGAPSRCTRQTGSCADGSVKCDANALCTETSGSAVCTCKPGYTGDGSTCTDVDECASNTDTCDANATCTNTVGGFTCACKTGYTGDGTTCTDINECVEPTTCASTQTCTNTPGSYTCTCEAPRTACGNACVNTTSDAAHCGACGNVCGEGQSCVESTCVGGGGSLQISATWSRTGDGNLMVTTPGGKLISDENTGPDNTDGGQKDQDSTDQGPENIFWASGVTPPSGEYHICFETAGFTPSPSPENPVTYTITVRQSGKQPQTFSKSYTSSAYTFPKACSPSQPGYVTSITYP
ncbi:EGF domain-containing protein [Cystobacter fuscus]|uniref:EGF domain-containing protein n=1 Tax=Cystobacter fuscus TaxID=43 RepID=UPI0037BEB291